MSSPSTALLASLVAANGRPKRLLIQDSSSSFVSNIGRIAGATPLHVPPGEIDRTLRGLIQGERLGPDHIWAVATHRDGHLAPPEWLSDCAPYGISTIDVCVGSLSALVRQILKASTFTIVDLDAEELFAGVHLTALLTDDQTLAARVRQMCLPGPNVDDYVFDASPRGLSHDEAGIMSLVSRTIAASEAQTPAPSMEDSPRRRSASSFSLVWNRRFQPEEKSIADATFTEEAGRSESAPPPQGKNPWLALLSDDHTRLERLQSAHDELVRRFQIAEEQSLTQTRRAAGLAASNEERADALRLFKAEADRTLASALEAKAALATKIVRVEADRDIALADSARREEASSSARDEQGQRALILERDLASAKEREASLRDSWETTRAQVLTRITEAEAQLKDALQARAEVLARAASLEATLASATVAKEGLAVRLAEVESVRDRLLSEAGEREAALKSALDEQRQRALTLERDLASVKEREESLSDGWETTRAQLLTRITQAEAESTEAQQARAEARARAASLEATLASATVAKEGLAVRLTEVESVRDRLLSEAGEREAALRSARDEQRQRALTLERDLASVKEREESLSDGWETTRAQFLSQIAQREAQALQADEARTEVLAQRAALKADLGSALSERAHLSTRLAQAEQTRAVLGTRVDELQRESAALALKNREAERALLQATQERAREADAAEAGLAEARASAEADMARAVEGFRGRLEGAEQAGEALKTALAARASEAAAHERSHAVADAHRMALEEQVAQLHRALEAIQQKDFIPAQGVVAATRAEEPQEETEQTRAPDRELASWAMLRPRFAGLKENSGASSMTAANDFIDFTAPSEDLPDGLRPPLAPEDAGLWREEPGQPTERPRSDFTPEYERRRSNPDETGARARGWLKGMADRIRRG